MNVIDFLRESSKFLVKDRPEIYEDESVAVEELNTAIELLREGDLPFGCVLFTSYAMIRLSDDGVEEFMLTRKLSSIIRFDEEETCNVYSHTHHIDLPSVLDEQDDE